MKRAYLKRKSDRQDIVSECDRLFLKILIIERGMQCELSGDYGVDIGLFHILPKKDYPRLRWSRRNVLITNWIPYHKAWHEKCSDDTQYKYVRYKLTELRGENFKRTLKDLHETMPKMNKSELIKTRAILTLQLKRYENG